MRELVSKMEGGHMFVRFHMLSRESRSQLATEGQWTGAKRSLRECKECDWVSRDVLSDAFRRLGRLLEDLTGF